MAEQPTPNGEGQPQTAAAPPRLSIMTQYVKDMSFENPRAPLGVQQGVRPEINVDARAEEQPVFLVELSYGGLFEIANVPSDSLQPLLQIECPRLLFPFARRVVADATRDGGFPPLMIDPIDFLTLYRRKLQAAAPSVQV